MIVYITQKQIDAFVEGARKEMALMKLDNVKWVDVPGVDDPQFVNAEPIKFIQIYPEKFPREYS